MFSVSPLYVAYLLPFLSFEYPLSVRLEFMLTHFLVLGALYRMLTGYCRRPLALLLTCAWVPALSVIEGGATVAGIGFLALYLHRPASESRRRDDILPASLLAATLCHTGYLFFLMGHIAGALWERFSGKAPLASPDASRHARTAIKAGLLTLLVLTALHPSKRWDRNYMMIDPAYSPMTMKDPLTIGFFQIGSWKEVMRKTPASAWVEQDWYFTLDKIYGGAQTIGQAFVSSPRVVLANLMSNVPDLLQTPLLFFVGYFPTVFLPTVCVFALAGVIGFGGMLSRFIEERRLSYALATLSGTAALLAALLLTWFNPRYSLALLPVGLLTVVHLERGAQRLEAAFRGLGAARARRVLVVLGAMLLVGGLVMNEWTCSFLLRKIVSPNARFNIRSFDVLLVLGAFVSWAAAAGLGRSFQAFSASAPRYADAIVFASALLVLTAAEYPHGRKAQIEAVLTGNAFLSHMDIGPNTSTTYPELLRDVTRDRRILSPEDTWLKAFANMDLDKASGIWGLPPFSDPSGKTEELLRGQDQIWVSKSWAADNPSVSTQAHLRYRLHVAPFLKKALAKGWTRREVARYGTVYSAPGVGTPQ